MFIGLITLQAHSTWNVKIRAFFSAPEFYLIAREEDPCDVIRRLLCATIDAGDNSFFPFKVRMYDDC